LVYFCLFTQQDPHYQDPKVVILDDPLSACDVIVARHIFSKIFASGGLLWNAGISQIWSTNLLWMTEHSTSCFVLHEGKVIFKGSLKEMKASPVKHVQETLIAARTIQQKIDKMRADAKDSDTNGVSTEDPVESNTATVEDQSNEEALFLMTQEERNKGTISFSAMKSYR